MRHFYQSDVRQWASLTMRIGNPFSRRSTAFSIFRPYVDWIQLSVAYSPMTRKLVFCFKEPALPPRSMTSLSHSRLFPKEKVPVKQKLMSWKMMWGGGLQSGNWDDRMSSPSSKSFETSLCRRTKSSVRSSSSMMLSSRTAASRFSISEMIGLSTTCSFATSHLYRKRTSSSDRKSSAISPRANPINSVTCRSSNRARLYELICSVSSNVMPFLNTSADCIREERAVNPKLEQYEIGVRSA